MVGCRFRAKNTLDMNYLYFAEKRGAAIIPETRAVDLRPRPGGGWEVATERATALLLKRRRTLTARKVVIAHPLTGTTLALEAPLPGELQSFLSALDAEEARVAAQGIKY
jgi:cholesterol oxidase